MAKPKSELITIGAVWVQKSKSGKEYWKGTFDNKIDELKAGLKAVFAAPKEYNLLVFPNTYKKNENQPAKATIGVEGRF